MEMLRPVQAKIRTFLDQNNMFTSTLRLIEGKTNVNREYLFYGIIGLLTLSIAIDWSNFLCNLVGIIYPVYASIKAIETPSSKDDTKWLMYWCVYAIFGIMEFFSDYLLFWIPLYSLTKCLFLIWLMIPGHNGGTHIMYNNFLRPFLQKYQTTIDNGIQRAREVVTDQSRNLMGELNQKSD